MGPVFVYLPAAVLYAGSSFRTAPRSRYTGSALMLWSGEQFRRQPLPKPGVCALRSPLLVASAAARRVPAVIIQVSAPLSSSFWRFCNFDGKVIRRSFLVVVCPSSSRRKPPDYQTYDVASTPIGKFFVAKPSGAAARSDSGSGPPQQAVRTGSSVIPSAGLMPSSGNAPLLPAGSNVLFSGTLPIIVT